LLIHKVQEKRLEESEEKISASANKREQRICANREAWVQKGVFRTRALRKQKIKQA
jgi:hypothetical protein